MSGDVVVGASGLATGSNEHAFRWTGGNVVVGSSLINDPVNITSHAFLW